MIDSFAEVNGGFFNSFQRSRSIKGTTKKRVYFSYLHLSDSDSILYLNIRIRQISSNCDFMFYLWVIIDGIWCLDQSNPSKTETTLVSRLKTGW